MARINAEVKEVLSKLSKTELIFIIGQMDRLTTKIGEICVDVSKLHMDTDRGIHEIRKCLMMLPHLHNEEILRIDIKNSDLHSVEREYDHIWDMYVDEFDEEKYI